MGGKPQQEHEWLHKLIGEWTCEGEADTGPGKPKAQWKASETVRSLGGLWTVAEGTGEMPGGGTAQTLMTLGYDPQKKRFVGTFAGSMMTNLWVYEGSLDEAGSVLTLDTEGPGMSGGGMTKYKDIIAIKDNDERTLTSVMLGDDGQWHQVMTATYRRSK